MKIIYIACQLDCEGRHVVERVGFEDEQSAKTHFPEPYGHVERMLCYKDTKDYEANNPQAVLSGVLGNLTKVQIEILKKHGLKF
jgi:hypothetical protein